MYIVSAKGKIYYLSPHQNSLNMYLKTQNLLLASLSWFLFENDEKFVKFVKIRFFCENRRWVIQLLKKIRMCSFIICRRFWYLTKIDFFSFFPALLLWKEIKQKQIPIVIWKWMSHCSRDSKCIHTQCVHLIIIISHSKKWTMYEPIALDLTYLFILKSPWNTYIINVNWTNC